LNRLRVLDAWRGLAALIVAMFHLQAIYPALVPGQPFAGCAAFVDFFFVLSGFVLARGYLRADFDIGAFAWQRIARLYPLHLYTLLVIVLLEAAKTWAQHAGGVGFHRGAFEGLGPASFIDNLLLLQVTGAVWHKISWNTPAWSLSAELAANVLVAVLAAVLVRRALVPVLVLIASLCFAILATGAMPISDYGPAALVRCLYAFALGCALYRGIAAVPPRVSKRGWDGLEALAALAIGGAVSLLPAAHWYLASPIFAFAIGVFAHERGAISRLMLALRLEFLGSISYSIYLNHIAVLIVSEKALALLLAAAHLPRPGTLSSVGFCGLYLAAVIVYSWLTYRAVERPGQRLLLGFRAQQARGAGGIDGAAAGAVPATA